MTQQKYLGIDGCKAGWFFVSIGSGNESEFGVFEKIEKLYVAYPNAKWMLIDIPIGLPSGNIAARVCDNEARKLLSPKRHHSIFSPPCREALSAPTYKEACSINQKITGRKISRQAYHVSKKILEVDILLQTVPKVRSIIRESHPEICFWALAGCKSMEHYKKTEDGLIQRLDLLKQHFPQSSAIYKAALDRYLRKDVAKDDILDALALAITASKLEEGEKRLPKVLEKDQLGVPMEIVYVIPDIYEKESERLKNDITIINNLEQVDPENSAIHADTESTYAILDLYGKTYLRINFLDSTPPHNNDNKNRSIQFSPEAIKQLQAIISSL